MDSGVHCPAGTPTFSFIGLCDRPMGVDANEKEHSVLGNPQIFSFFSFINMLLEIYFLNPVFMLIFGKNKYIEERHFSAQRWFLSRRFLFVSCMNDSWPVTFPKGSGWSFSDLGLGWGLDDRRAEGRKCKPIHIRPHLDLKRRLFMRDRYKSSILHIHSVRTAVHWSLKQK